jgi:hypothetical protein
MSERDLLAELRAPFEPEDVKWRIQTAGMGGNNKPWAMIVPYITSRAIHQRLDEVFPLAWENAHKPTPDGKGWLCGITVHAGDRSITRWDGAELTNIEPLKGGLSGSMKRAGVLFGIGRYLYQLDKTIWADCKVCDSERNAAGNFQRVTPKNGGEKFGLDWKPPQLPAWAVPHTDYTPFIKAMAIAETMADLQDAFKDAYLAAKAAQNTGLGKEFKDAYDKHKAILEGYLALNMTEELATVGEWLDRQIKSGVELMPNMSALETLKKAVLNDLDKRCQGQAFDSEPLKKKFATAYAERKRQLETKG